MERIATEIKTQLVKITQDIKSNETKIKTLTDNINFLTTTNNKLNNEKDMLVKMLKIKDDKFDVRIFDLNDENDDKKNDDILLKIEKLSDDITRIKWQPVLLINSISIEHNNDKYILVKNTDSLDIYNSSFKQVRKISHYEIEEKTNCYNDWKFFNFRIFDDKITILNNSAYPRVEKRILKNYDLKTDVYYDVDNSKNDYEYYINLKKYFTKNIELHKELFVPFKINKYNIIIKYSGSNKTLNTDYYEIIIDHKIFLPVIITDKHEIGIYFNYLMVINKNNNDSCVYDFN